MVFMKNFTSINKVKGFTTKQSVKISERTMANKNMVEMFLVAFADVILFIVHIFKETFSPGFEFKEFFRQ